MTATPPSGVALTPFASTAALPGGEPKETV